MKPLPKSTRASFLAVDSFLSAPLSPYVLIFSCGLASLFLLPMMLDLILHFPGQMTQYLGYSKQHHHNSVAGALKFLSYYWSGGLDKQGTLKLAPIFLGLASQIWMLWQSHKKHIGSNIGSPVMAVWQINHVLLLASIAMLFYALFGVDRFNETYIGIFYFSVPALTYALLLFMLMQFVGQQKTLLTWFVIAGACCLAWRNIHRTPEYANEYGEPNLPAHFEKLKQHIQQRPSLPSLSSPTQPLMAFDLDKTTQWPHVWSSMVGFKNIAKRTGVPFCIHQNWDILFTREARCSPAQLLGTPRYRVSATEPLALPANADVWQVHGLWFVRLPAESGQ